MPEKIKTALEPRCEYCSRGELTADKQSVLCVKKGVMLPHSSCRRFSYDPLKREPKPLPKKQQFSPEDFSLL